VGALFGREECVEAEAFFATDNAVLDDEGAVAEPNPHHHEDEGHGDPPEVDSPVGRPVVDGDVDGEDEVEQEHGQDEEVIGRIEAGVVLEVLRSGHWSPLGSRFCRRASAYHLVG